MLSDSEWDNGLWDGDFTVFEPNDCMLPSQATKFKITYDDKYLYVGIRCLDSVLSNINQGTFSTSIRFNYS
ncbi:hypothetical protein [Maribacter arcticus]|uniref:hypothetical protein n=1 Tax=Maribacter arcticus TaxID=561365 RepID=UPI003C6D149D